MQTDSITASLKDNFVEREKFKHKQNKIILRENVSCIVDHPKSKKLITVTNLDKQKKIEYY